MLADVPKICCGEIEGWDLNIVSSRWSRDLTILSSLVSHCFAESNSSQAAVDRLGMTIALPVVSVAGAGVGDEEANLVLACSFPSDTIFTWYSLWRIFRQAFRSFFSTPSPTRAHWLHSSNPGLMSSAASSGTCFNTRELWTSLSFLIASLLN